MNRTLSVINAVITGYYATRANRWDLAVKEPNTLFYPLLKEAEAELKVRLSRLGDFP